MNRCQFFNQMVLQQCERYLPYAYQQVEYLEGTGTQYINTGVVPLSSDVIAATYQFTNIQVSDNSLFYIDNGAYTNNACGFSSSYYSNVGSYVCGWGGATTISNPSPDLNKHILNLSNGVFTLDNNVLATRSGSVSLNKNLWLFGWNRNNSVAIYGKVKVFRFTITSSSNEKRIDLIPCYRKSDNKPGMYDPVSETFFTNAGTGEFTVGSSV